MLSPTHRIGVIDTASAALTLAFTSASSSLWYCRRSECPHSTYEQPSLASIGPEMSPVYAPLGYGDRSCAPYLIWSLSPSVSVCTLRRSENGGSTTTSVNW